MIMDLYIPPSLQVSMEDAVHRCHLAPNPSLWEYERRLKKLATKGGENRIYSLINSSMGSLTPTQRKVSLVNLSLHSNQFIC